MSDDVTTESTSQRARIEVPNPWTELTVGLIDSDTSYSGVAVDTDEHVRLYGKGGTSDSDLIAQATGQVWIQALQNTVGLAKEKVVVSAVSSTMFTADRGITIMAGFSPSDLEVEEQPGVLPSAVEAYDSHATTAQTVGLSFATAAGALAATAKAFEAIKGTSFSKSCAGSAASNVAGLGVNLTAAVDRDLRLPMIHLYSEAGTVMGSALNSVNITSVVGTLVGSTFVTHHGLANSKVRGWRRASLNAIGPVDVSGLLYVGCRAVGSFTVAARGGGVSVRGKEMTIGQPLGKVKASQQPAETIEVNALDSVELSSMKDLKIDATSSISSKAGSTTTMEATTAVRMKSGPWKIEVTPSSATIGTEGPCIEITNAGVKMTGLAVTATAEMGNNKVDLAAGTGSIKIVPGTSITVDGMEFKYQ